MIVIHFEVYNYNSNIIETYKTENFNELQTLFEEIYQVWTTNGRERYYNASALFYKIFAFIMKDCTLTEKSEIRTVSDAKHIMQIEYSNRWFVYLILFNPLIYRAFRHLCFRYLCIFPCFFPYEQIQGKFFTRRPLYLVIWRRSVLLLLSRERRYSSWYSHPHAREAPVHLSAVRR